MRAPPQWPGARGAQTEGLHQQGAIPPVEGLLLLHGAGAGRGLLASWAEANVREWGGERQETPKKKMGVREGGGAGEGVVVQGREVVVWGEGGGSAGQGVVVWGGGRWCRAGGGAGQGVVVQRRGAVVRGGGEWWCGEGGRGRPVTPTPPPWPPGSPYSSGVIHALGCGVTVQQNWQELGGLTPGPCTAPGVPRHILAQE